MDTILHDTSLAKPTDPNFALELSAKALESALYIALLEAQRSNFPALPDLIALHQQAGDFRRRLDAEARG